MLPQKQHRFLPEGGGSSLSFLMKPDNGCDDWRVHRPMHGIGTARGSCRPIRFIDVVAVDADKTHHDAGMASRKDFKLKISFPQPHLTRNHPPIFFFFPPPPPGPGLKRTRRRSTGQNS